MKRSSASVFFVVCFGLFLLAVPILTLLLPKAENSYYENRTLAEVPQFSSEALLSGDYFNDWEEWFTDHVAFRSYLMKAQTFLQLKVLRQSVVNDVVTDSDVLLGHHGYGAWDTSYLASDAEEAAAALSNWAEVTKENGGQFYYVGLPEQYAYYQDHYPDYLENRSWLYGPTEEAMETALSEVDIPFLSLYTRYQEAGFPRDYYFASDHHYTIEGALFACREVLSAVNERQGLSLYIPSEEDLTFTTLPNPFLGSRNRKLFALDDKGDQLTVAEYREAIPFTRTDNGKQVEPSRLTLPENDTDTVTYTAFMGGDIAETIIDTNREELPNVLVIGESFTNAMETLLYASFNETRSIDPRYYTGSIADYIAAYQPDVVLLVRDNTAYFTGVMEG